AHGVSRVAEPVDGRLRAGLAGWLRRNRIRIAAGLTGLSGFFGTLAGTDTPTVETWVLAMTIGVLTPLPVVLVEGTFRNAVERLFESPEKGTALPAAPAGGADPPSHPPPERLSTFRGRAAKLAELRDLHDRERQARSPDDGRPPAMGPVVLLIHGKPGVGKSVLAQELARQLAAKYPDGVLYANFGTAGRPRAPAEILKTFLLALDWPEQEMPGDATDRAVLLRSLTAGRR